MDKYRKGLKVGPIQAGLITFCDKEKMGGVQRHRASPDGAGSQAAGRESLQLLFKQHQYRVIKLFNGKSTRRRNENSVIAGNSAQNPFRFAK